MKSVSMRIATFLFYKGHEGSMSYAETIFFSSFFFLRLTHSINALLMAKQLTEGGTEGRNSFFIFYFS